MAQMTVIAQNFRELPTNKVIAKENVNPIFNSNNFSRGLFDEPKEFYLSDKQINMQINKRFLSELPGYDTIYDNTAPQKVINYGPSLDKLFRPAKKQKIVA